MADGQPLPDIVGGMAAANAELAAGETTSLTTARRQFEADAG